MLSIARQEASSARFVRSTAESLPFFRCAFDLITVSMAFHWLDQPRFLAEAARVLSAGAELWVYNLYFPGVLHGDEAFSSWHHERYLAQYPIPSRQSQTLASLLRTQQFPLVFRDQRNLSFAVTFTATELRSYLTTQSNVEAALRNGADLPGVDKWLDQELAPFFRSGGSRRFSYMGAAEIAVVT